MILALRNIQHHDDLATQHIEKNESFHKEICHKTDPKTDKRTNYEQESEELRKTSHKQENDDIDNTGEEENKGMLLVPKIRVT